MAVVVWQCQLYGRHWAIDGYKGGGGGGGVGGKVAKDLGTSSLDFKPDRTVRGKTQTSIIAFSISTSKQLPLAPFARRK